LVPSGVLETEVGVGPFERRITENDELDRQLVRQAKVA
jgi:hypothetical protein